MPLCRRYRVCKLPPALLLVIRFVVRKHKNKKKKEEALMSPLWPTPWIFIAERHFLPTAAVRFPPNQRTRLRRMGLNNAHNAPKFITSLVHAERKTP